MFNYYFISNNLISFTVRDPLSCTNQNYSLVNLPNHFIFKGGIMRYRKVLPCYLLYKCLVFIVIVKHANQKTNFPQKYKEKLK